MWTYNGKKRPAFAIEPKNDQESVWDYPRPPLIQGINKEVKICWQDQIIAHTNEAIRICETASPPTVYIPEKDIKMELLNKVEGSSFCEWKGMAQYWSVSLNGITLKRIGWTYSNPPERYRGILKHIAFYATPWECYIGDEKVEPQDSRGYYGGWVTKQIIGPWKGGSDPRANGL